jgi:hypothetical protein
MSDLLDRINDIRSTVRPRPTFTLERRLSRREID